MEQCTMEQLSDLHYQFSPSITENELAPFLTITLRRMSTTSCLVGMPLTEFLKKIKK